MANIFCLWSGGLDSTYMVAKLLADNHNVGTGYIKLSNNVNKSEREINARNHMLKYFYKFANFADYGILQSINIHHVSGRMSFHQAQWWLNSIASIPKQYDKLAIGYVMNDDAISYLKDFENIVDSLNLLTTEKIDVIFPIIKMKKGEMWDYISPEIKKFVTWCEDEDIENEDHCGKCNPCRKAFSFDNIKLFFENKKHDKQMKFEFMDY